MSHNHSDICIRLKALRKAYNCLLTKPARDLNLSRALLNLMGEIPQLPLPGAYETARSLSAFQASLGTHIPSREDIVQIITLLGNLCNIVCPEADEAEDPEALVTPITPSGKNPLERVALYLNSEDEQSILQEALEVAGFMPYLIKNMSQVLGEDPDFSPPVAIVADLSLCRTDKATRTVIQRLRSEQQLFQPHLFCLADEDDFPARLESVRLGATRFLSKPLDSQKLLAVLRGVTDRIPHEPYRVLLVDDDHATTLVHAEIIKQGIAEVKTVNDPKEALSVAIRFRPDVVVMDMYMPGCNGLELASILRQDDDLADTPIVFLSAETSMQRQLLAIDLGVDDFLTKPANPQFLRTIVLAKAKRARMLRRTRQEYRQIAFRLNALLPTTAPHPSLQQIWGLDTVRRMLVAPNGVSVTLSIAELDLVGFMAGSPGHGASRKELMTTLGDDPDSSDGTRLEALISRLRRKTFAKCGIKIPIRSDYGHGYSFAGRLHSI